MHRNIRRIDRKKETFRLDIHENTNAAEDTQILPESKSPRKRLEIDKGG
ncbi:MAG: hypothetical protein NZ901_02465 [Geminocystis sp.]|nr:hypothetical protein [Geminocystis sp.]HIK37805.1 hypothetical protein [Geminocystis sp. M7585_C2015_104]MCS7147034.1 hypothetical protein [Geminocystis sp.]MCX8077345.1 hypothetical protein [Geminocystis sp.]MDW8115857.1 hypothetical protein [Geminocystis sp.]